MERKKIKVQADHKFKDSFEEVSQNLQKAGMTVQDSLIMLGHFRGIAKIEDIENLKKVPGVASVDIVGNLDDKEKDDYSV